MRRRNAIAVDPADGDELADDDSWPVGGSRLRPTFPTTSSSSRARDADAEWERAMTQELPGLDDNWEEMLAAALGITAQAPPVAPDGSVHDAAPGDGVATAPLPDAAPAVADEAAPVPQKAALQPAPASWTGDDILPNRRTAGSRRGLFRR